mgnify:CR=1 FL=1
MDWLMGAIPEILVAVFSTLLIAWWSGRPKLRVFVTPMAEFDRAADEQNNWPATVFRVESLFLQNNNLSKPVTDIEIIFSSPPADLSVKPHAEYESKAMENGRWLLKIAKIQPRSNIKVDICYFGQFGPSVVSLNTSEGPKNLEAAVYNSMVPTWKALLFGGFASIGLATIVFAGWFAVTWTIEALSRASG